MTEVKELSEGESHAPLFGVMEMFSEQELIYAPNSIRHGQKIRSTSVHDDAILLRIELERMRDFLQFLFEHSEHCDHISQSKAWMEFCEWEVKQKLIE